MVVVKGHEEVIVILYRCGKEAWDQITWITATAVDGGGMVTATSIMRL